MMRRLTLFLAFLLLAGLLAPAHMVKASTVRYYGLSFDGDDYVKFTPTNLPSANSPRTVIVIARLDKYPSEVGQGWEMLFSYGAGTATQAQEFALSVDYGGHLAFNSQANDYVSSFKVQKGASFLAGVRYSGGATIDIIYNTQIETGALSSGLELNTTTSVGYVGAYSTGGLKWFGDVYLVLVYNRALSDAEIQQIYQDPLHPPTDGLVLWYAPDSVDTATNTWHDKSGNGNDGTIVGATPERVSIPKLYVYDKKTSRPVNLTKVSVNTLGENYTKLLPGLLTLPPNSTITLQVGATGYLPTVLQVNTSASSVVAWLEPLTVEKQLVQYNVTQMLHSGLGNNIIIGFIFLTVFLIAGLKAGLGAGAILVIFLPLVLAMGFYGYLPMPVAFVATAIAGFGTFYVIRAAIGGDYR